MAVIEESFALCVWCQSNWWREQKLILWFDYLMWHWYQGIFHSFRPFNWSQVNRNPISWYRTCNPLYKQQQQQPQKRRRKKMKKRWTWNKVSINRVINCKFRGYWMVHNAEWLKRYKKQKQQLNTFAYPLHENVFNNLCAFSKSKKTKSKKKDLLLHSTAHTSFDLPQWTQKI